jgi:hypothetical protein
MPDERSLFTKDPKMMNHFKKIDHPALNDPGRRSKAPEASETAEKPQARQLIRPRLLT